MTGNALRELDVTGDVAMRSQWEAFEFSLEAPGLVLVRNTSWENPENHEYRVNVVDGTPTACECPAAKFHEGACKHMAAVAIRGPVLEAAKEEGERFSEPSEQMVEDTIS